MKILVNGFAVTLSDSTGAIRSLITPQGRELVTDGEHSNPFELLSDEGSTSTFQSFNLNQSHDSSIDLRWQISDSDYLETTVVTSGEQIHFQIVNFSLPDSVKGIKYPILAGVGRLSDDHDHLLHSYATGLLIDDPIDNLTKEENGFPLSPYPESFSGPSMQLMAYYAPQASLVFSSNDTQYLLKSFNAYKEVKTGLLNFEMIHFIAHESHSCETYAITLSLSRTLTDWYLIADDYRKNWLAAHPSAKKKQPNWLLNKVGLATFGINAGHDRVKYLKELHKLINAPMYHILGPDWTQDTQDFMSGIPGDREGWLPTKFSQKNLDVIKDQGDYSALFEFDYLLGKGADTGSLAPYLMKISSFANSLSKDEYLFQAILCPSNDAVRQFHDDRDKKLVETTGTNALYYDISANNLMKDCESETHDHAPDDTAQISKDYIRNYQSTKIGIKQALHKEVLMGTEMMNEEFIGTLDFYQARAGGKPVAPLEAWSIRHLIEDGKASVVPLFDYTFSEYGPQRLDGWGKLTKESGDLFFYNVAKIYLSGGLYELNYEYSPMESYDFDETDPSEHYFRFAPRHYKIDLSKAAYLNQYAHFRIGKYNKFLTLGHFVRPLPLSCGTVDLNWNLYSASNKADEYESQGSLTVSTIVHSVVEHNGKRLFTFANVSEVSQTATIQRGDFEVLVDQNVTDETLFTEGATDTVATIKYGSDSVIITIPARSICGFVTNK